MNRKLMAATSVAFALTLGLTACGSSSDGADETTTTEADSSDTTEADSSSTTEEDSGSTETETYEPTGEKTVYGGVDIEIAEAELRPADPDEGEAEDTTTLAVTLDLENSIEDGRVDFFMDGTELLVGDEEFEVGLFPGDTGSGISLEGGDSGEMELVFYDVPEDLSFDDSVLLLAENDMVPAVLPFTGSAESPLPVKINPDQTLQPVDGSDLQFDMVIDEVTRTWDIVTEDFGDRAEDGTTFLRFDLTFTAGTSQVCIGGDFFRMAADGEVEPTVSGSTINQCIQANTQTKAVAFLVLPDDATDAVVRIGDPGNDPEYTEWPVPIDELGGEIDFDTILEEIISGESSSSSSSSDDEDEDSDESTTTTEE